MPEFDTFHYDQKWGIYDTFRAIGTAFRGYVVTTSAFMGNVITGQKDRGNTITAQKDKGEKITGV